MKTDNWILKTRKYILFAVAILTATISSCSDDIIAEGAGGVSNGDDDFKGEMVQFTVGTTENSTHSRAGGANTYYMPDGSHFVCRMYYKAQTAADTFDISGGSDRTAWLKVKGSVGNSLYWNSNYASVDEGVKGKGGVDDYGNDFSATAFYWQNRKEHAFLAWTDLNKASTITGGDSQGSLKFGKDEMYTIYTGATTMEWTTKNYYVYGIDEPFSSIDEIQEYIQKEAKGTSMGESEEFRLKQQELTKSHNWNDAGVTYYYQHGWQYKYSPSYAQHDYNGADEATATERDYGWIQYQMFFEKLPFKDPIPNDAEKVYDEKNHDLITFVKDPETHKYIAAAEVRKDDEGHFLDKYGNVTTEPANYAYDYYLTDDYGNIKYNENNPKYVFYYKEHQKKEEVKVVEQYPVLAFDLTHGDKTSMTQQPDIVQAVEIQSPSGATQESNRVNLYFKHQFSQVQVNIKNSADNSVSINKEDIKKVELLGVTEKGYVHTELDKDGKVKPATYQDIDFSKYTEQQLKDNQFGTSFQMFPSDNIPYDYLSSFNAIAYGQLQAIRITWKEADTDYEHAATYRIPNTDLMNLKSGVRYVWNIEIRRGTLAIIRTEVVDWELPKDEAHNGSADGTIQN